MTIPYGFICRRSFSPIGVSFILIPEIPYALFSWYPTVRTGGLWGFDSPRSQRVTAHRHTITVTVSDITAWISSTRVWCISYPPSLVMVKWCCEMLSFTPALKKRRKNSANFPWRHFWHGYEMTYCMESQRVFCDFAFHLPLDLDCSSFSYTLMHTVVNGMCTLRFCKGSLSNIKALLSFSFICNDRLMKVFTWLMSNWWKHEKTQIATTRAKTTSAFNPQVVALRRHASISVLSSFCRSDRVEKGAF